MPKERIGVYPGKLLFGSKSEPSLEGDTIVFLAIWIEIQPLGNESGVRLAQKAEKLANLRIIIENSEFPASVEMPIDAQAALQFMLYRQFVALTIVQQQLPPWIPVFQYRSNAVARCLGYMKTYQRLAGIVGNHILKLAV